MWIKIITKKDWEAIKAEKEKMQKALSDIMGKYENLHRLHDGLYERFKNEFKKKYETLKSKKV